MAKTWVLDTETKGTGAHMEPLRSHAQRAEPELNVTRFRPPESPPAPKPAPVERRFRVFDVLGGRTVAEEVPIAAALRVLAGMRSPLDARVYVREAPGGRWRMLSIAETRALWGFRRSGLGGGPAR
jgi:hypothetical protein